MLCPTPGWAIASKSVEVGKSPSPLYLAQHSFAVSTANAEVKSASNDLIKMRFLAHNLEVLTYHNRADEIGSPKGQRAKREQLNRSQGLPHIFSIPYDFFVVAIRIIISSRNSEGIYPG
jgi:hypothetical protein